MHPADVKCALEKAGWSLRRLSVAHGYEAGSARMALRQPWPKVERIIADAIGREPWEVWPDRYTPDHRPRRGLRRRTAKA